MSKKSILEQALLQVEAFEEVVKENSKGIVASTMKQELNDLVKEALEDEEANDEAPDAVDDVTDDEPVDDETDDEPVDDETSVDGEDSEDDDESDFEEGPESEDSFGEIPDEEESMDELPDEDEDETLDMTGASDSEVLKVFRAMRPEDGIVVKKDGNKLELTVDDEDYIIKLDDDSEENLSEQLEELDSEWTDLNPQEEEESWSAEEEGWPAEEEEGWSEEGFQPEEEQMYEINLGEEEEEEECVKKGEFEEEVSGKDPFTKGVNKNRNQKSSLGGKTYQGKGGAVGDDDPFDKTANKTRNQKSNLGGGKLELGKGGPVGDDDPFNKGAQKGEFKEAARTKTNAHGNKGKNNPKDAASGRRFELKGKTMYKAGSGENLAEQVTALKKQNAEYKKALVLFKEKLNEVAVFNANLALSMRLITENTTTKQEKLNILKRFDSVSTITESKKLYSTIKTELETKKPVTEAVVDKIASTPTSSSKDVLSENKVYENAQFKRMKELMGVLKK